MASMPLATAGKVQMIKPDSSFAKIGTFVNDLSIPYTVMSIIGRQSSGKSFLLNHIFATNFNVLDIKAAGGRKRTTEGIWIAKCSNPRMIVMDVEGSDGMGGTDKSVFARRSALFALTVSDVLLLNIMFTDIGTENGACGNIIKLLFQEIVNIGDGYIRTVIIVVRDHDDYAECHPEITRKSLQTIMDELWCEVHSQDGANNRKMSDYLEIIVKDFPRIKEKEFAQKAKDLAKFLRDFAARNDNRLHFRFSYPSFDVCAEKRWVAVCVDKMISTDEKLAISEFVCNTVMEEMWNSMKNKEEYMSLVSDHESMCLHDFHEKLLLLINDISKSFERRTGATDKNIRDKTKKMLDNKIAEMFLKTFNEKLSVLRTNMESKGIRYDGIYKELNKRDVLDENTIIEVISSYLAPFDIKDLHEVFKADHENCRVGYAVKITKVAQRKAKDIQVKRGVFITLIAVAKVLPAVLLLDPVSFTETLIETIVKLSEL